MNETKRKKKPEHLKNPHAVAVGRLGGLVKSSTEKQKAAARRNGRLGGRPREQVRPQEDTDGDEGARRTAPPQHPAGGAVHRLAVHDAAAGGARGEAEVRTHPPGEATVVRETRNRPGHPGPGVMSGGGPWRL